MARFPRINSLCPLSAQAIGEIKNNFCEHCRRTVHNLDGMSDAERVAFMRQCDGSVCVSYSVRKTVVAAAALTSLLGSGAVFATDAFQQPDIQLPRSAAPGQAAPVKTCPDEKLIEIVLTAGSVSHPQDADWEEHGDDDVPAIPEIDDKG